MNFNGILDAIKGAFAPQPTQLFNNHIPDTNTLAQRGIVSPLPQSNQPDQSMQALQTIRKARPDLKLNDTQVLDLYKKYGPKLLDEINTAPVAQATPAPQAAQVTPHQVLGASTGGGGYEQQHPNFDSILQNFVFPQTRAAHIPDAVAAGQTALESGYGDSPAAVNQHNLHGIMQWDSNGNRSLRSFGSASDSAKIYAATVTKILQAKGFNPEGMKPADVLRALQSGTAPRYEGDNANPLDYVKKIQELAAYQKYAQ